MKLAAYILWLAALGLLCVGTWAHYAEQEMWGLPYYRVVGVTMMIAPTLAVSASFLMEKARRRQGIVRPPPAFTLIDPRSKEWATAGGVGVILVTGLAAFGDGRGYFDGSPVSAVLAVLVAALTLGGAFAMHRFVARHGDEIGEARFDTRNKDEDRP